MNQLNKILKRRKLIKFTIAAPFIPISIFGLTGCGDTTSENNDSSNNDNSSESSNNDNSTVDTSGNESSSGSWSSGTTALITTDYPDDSIFETGNTCSLALTQETTLGPCYFEDDTGEDISLGNEGLPMQLCLRLVDSNCEPLANYIIEIWHCDTQGLYSGDTSNSANATSFAGGFCTGGDNTAGQSTWYRGQLTTDSNGRVNFRTCFPGWYNGRTIHIHFSARHSSGVYGVTSQFCFTDELTNEICTTHNLYSSRGEQDTPLSDGRDTVFPSTGYDDFLLTTQQNTDGTLLAYQTIQII